jgi:hypothetical protein
VHFAQQRQPERGIITGVSTIIMDIYHRPGYYYYFEGFYLFIFCQGEFCDDAIL